MGRLWDDWSWGGERCPAGDCCCGHWGDSSVPKSIIYLAIDFMVFRVILLSKWLQLSRSSSPRLKMSWTKWTPGMNFFINWSNYLWLYLPSHQRCVKQHGESGLTKACLESQISLEEAESMVMKVTFKLRGNPHQQFNQGDWASHSEREESPCW